MRITTLLLFALFFSWKNVACQEGKALFQKKTYSEGNQKMPYRILLPQNYDANTTYPLLIMLHGAGERGDDNEAQLTHGTDLFLKAEIRKNYPAIIVFPQCSKDGYWSNVDKKWEQSTFKFTFSPKGEPTPQMEVLQRLIIELTKKHKVDTSRIYVGGLSMGGMGTFEIVRRNPELFAGAFAICGGAHPNTASEMTKTPFWVFHGDKDVVVDYQHSVKIVNALKAAGGNVKFTTYEGVNHDSWTNAFSEDELLPWLFSNKKD